MGMDNEKMLKKINSRKSLRKSIRKSIIFEKKIVQIKEENQEKKHSIINKIKEKFSKKKKKEQSKNFKVPLEIVMDDPELTKYFKLHLIKEYAVENILFFEQLNLYKNQDDPSVRYQIANDIYTDFLTSNSLNEVFLFITTRLTLQIN
jgi:hypothetical protein